MASQILWVSVFLLFNSALSSTVQVCKTNQEWRKGYKPEPSCSNFFPTETTYYEGCYCKTNYVRDAKDECIFYYDCPEFKPTPPPTCPAGESYRTDLYPEPTCENLYPEAKEVKEGCFCDDYTVRDAAGKCTSVYECPQLATSTTTASTPVCPPGELFGIGMYPEPSCDEFYPENIDYYEGCFCQDNFVRDDSGKCISYLECPQLSQRSSLPEPTCPEGEVYKEYYYPEPTCDDIDPLNVTIKAGCFCLGDFSTLIVRDSSGKCIDYFECPQILLDYPSSAPTVAPKTCPEGEEFRLDSFPEPSCDNLYPEEANSTIKEDCFCIDRYKSVRDSSGKCIPSSSCPQFATTPSPPSSALKPVAAQPNDPAVYTARSYLPTFKCVPGSTFKVDCNTCTCNRDGSEALCTLMECVPEIVTEPSTKCPANEVWKNGLYPEPTCDNFYPENVYVKEGCYCKDDYIRNAEGKCIEIGECDIFKSPPSPSDVTIYEFCCTPGETFQVDCNLCTCAEDGKSTICTTFNCAPSDCKTPPKCPEGEIYGNGMYPEATCDNFYPEYTEIKEGCFCAPGLVRDSTGKCISIYECSPCKRSDIPNPVETYTPAEEEFRCCPGTATYYTCLVCICNEDGKSETCYATPCPNTENYNEI